MIGLVIFVVGVIYLTLLYWATRAAYRWAMNKGLSKTRSWVVGAGGFLVIYLPVFWDHIPTLFAKQYLCVTEARFQVFKTVEQWKKENSGIFETLSPPSPSGSPSRYEKFDDGHGKTNTYFLNERFRWIVTQQDLSRILPIIRREEQLVDSRKNEVLARYVDFGTGNSVKNTIGPPGPLKFWLRSGKCWGGGENQDSLRNIRDDFSGRKK